jgi:predicted unusual protein kinase regulating ubiquinone biosynthesis (AarF/ABC1/UbiB family)
VTEKRRSRVPASRIERLARMGWMAGELAAGGLVEGARRFFGGETAGAGSALLSGANAQRLARRLAQLRGAAMKLGQLLSLESADILPPEFAEALALLRASADTMPSSQVRRVLGREYGAGWEARFQRFELEPVASASIGQVHEAVAADGRRLALKIQYPGVARSIESDVDNVASLLRLAKLLPGDLDLSGIIAEAKRQLRQEADYLQEAQSLRRYGALVAGDDALRVPGVHDDLTTRRILAMDFARGDPIESLAQAGVPQARRDAAGLTLERLVLRELFEFRFMQTDPNFANYFLEPGSGRIVLLDFGSTRELPAELVQRYARIVRATMAGDRLPAPQAGGLVPALRTPACARGRQRAGSAAGRPGVGSRKSARRTGRRRCPQRPGSASKTPAQRAAQARQRPAGPRFQAVISYPSRPISSAPQPGQKVLCPGSSRTLPT